MKWGNGPPPTTPPGPGQCTLESALVSWGHETDYPVFHDVLFYNPGVRDLVVKTLPGQDPGPEPVITPQELVGLLLFLDGRAF